MLVTRGEHRGCGYDIRRVWTGCGSSGWSWGRQDELELTQGWVWWGEVQYCLGRAAQAPSDCCYVGAILAVG